MLKVFQKVRQKLLNEGQLRKYLIYALGEILLVVVGILIALQINNWNINRISKQTENAILLRLINDLEADHLRYAFLDSSYQATLKKNQDFETLIKKNTYSEDELSNVLSFFGARAYEINPRWTTYEEMLNSGKIYTLSDELLVNQIIEYYRGLKQAEIDISTGDADYARYWGGPELIEFWHLKNIKENDIEVKRLNKDLLSKKDQDDYKHLLNAVRWGQVMTKFNIRRINNLMERNSELRKNINAFLIE